MLLEVEAKPIYSQRQKT